MEGFRLFDTYIRYKIGQNKFTSWLKQTAEKYGYHSSNDDKEKTNGQSKKSNSNQKIDTSTGTIVRMAELAGLAKAVAAQSDVIPQAVVQILRDVIAQRKKAAGYYEKRSGHQAPGGDGHLHVIGVLEEVLQIFEGASKGKDEESALGKTKGGMNSAEAQMSNLFELLDIEEPNAADELSARDMAPRDVQTVESEETTTAAKKTLKSKPKKGSKARGASKAPTGFDSELDLAPETIQYKMESDDDEIYFLLYCFFEDFNEEREYLQERWCDYQDGIISLSAVAVITNTSFDMFQRAEKELISQIPRGSGLKSYEKIADLLFIEQGLAHVDYESQPQKESEDLNERIYEEADWLCLPVFWNFSNILRRLGPTTIPIVPPVAGLPRNGPHGAEEKLAWGKEVMMELLGEACVIKALKKQKDFAIPAEDELTRGLTQMLMTRHIPIWLIFACQVYLDIRYIMESDIDRGHKELVAKGACVTSILEHYIEFSKDVTRQTPKLLRVALGEVECWITEDFADSARSNVRKGVGVSTEGLEPYFYLRRNPLLCGLMVFREDLTLHEHGLAIANAWGATVAAAHLYNAVRHELPGFAAWMDMEVLIAMHGLEHIFVGSCPCNIGDYYKRYELAVGISVSNFARGNHRRHDTALIPSSNGPRGLPFVSKVSQVFHERYCFAHDHPVLTLENLETLLNDSVQSKQELENLSQHIKSSSWPSPPSVVEARARAEMAARASVSHPHLKKQFQRSHALTPIQLLDTLGSSIEHESAFLTYNYFSMHERCTRLLRAIYAELEKDILAPSGSLEEARGELPLLARYIFQVMIKEEEGSRSGMWEGKVIEKVGRVMKAIVEEEGNAEILAIRAG